MKKYHVIINGTDYEVGVELLEDNGEAHAAPTAKSDTAPVAVKTDAAPAASTTTAAVSGGETIFCPLAGTLCDVQVKVGDSIKRGQVLFLIEALKMENEIMAPHDGKILSVSAVKGTAVKAGEPLCVIG